MEGFDKLGNHNPRWVLNSVESGQVCTVFAMQANSPLRAIVQEKLGRNAFLPTEKSFFTVSANNVLISTIKKCEDDNSVVVRLYDIEGKDSKIKFNTFFSIDGSEHTNIIEEEGKMIPASGKSLKTKIGHHAIETFKLIHGNPIFTE